MGFAIWFLCGVAAFGLARIVPAGRRKPWLGELTAAILMALALGFVATALDFGGWNEADWRAALFAFLGALAATGLLRGVTMRP